MSPNKIVSHQMLFFMKCQFIESVSTLNHASNEKKQVFEALKWNGNAEDVEVLFLWYIGNHLEVCFLIFPHTQLTTYLITVVSHSNSSFVVDQKKY